LPTTVAVGWQEIATDVCRRLTVMLAPDVVALSVCIESDEV